MNSAKLVGIFKEANIWVDFGVDISKINKEEKDVWKDYERFELIVIFSFLIKSNYIESPFCFRRMSFLFFK